MTSDPSERTALCRYLAIAEAVGVQLEPAQQRQLLKERAALVHELPDGSRREYSPATLRRWLRLYQERGLDGLRPQRRRDQGSVRAHPELIEEACRLRRELPARSANQISRILELRHGVRVPARSIRRHLRDRGLLRGTLGDQPLAVFGRFQAERPNQLWIADFLDGPSLPFGSKPSRRRPTHLLLVLDDYSRLIVHARWVLREDARSAQLVFRQAVVARGRPDALYCDQGSAFISAALVRTCAVLGVRLIHSRPYRPQGRGKQERSLGTVRQQFLIEAEHERIQTLAQLNDCWAAWAEGAYHRQVHSETGEAPLQRYLERAPAADLDPDLLFEAFRWASSRKVNSTALVSLFGNRYQAPPALVGRRVELRYEPEDLSRIEVWYEQRSYGAALPFQISRHVHPQLAATVVNTPAVEATEPANPGYLAELQARYEHEHFGQVDYRPALKKEQP
jgi:putative transposase